MKSSCKPVIIAGDCQRGRIICPTSHFQATIITCKLFSCYMYSLWFPASPGITLLADIFKNFPQSYACFSAYSTTNIIIQITLRLNY